MWLTDLLWITFVGCLGKKLGPRIMGRKIEQTVISQTFLIYISTHWQIVITFTNEWNWHWFLIGPRRDIPSIRWAPRQR